VDGALARRCPSALISGLGTTGDGLRVVHKRGVTATVTVVDGAGDTATKNVDL
jgi:hypothetical protein